MRSLRKTHLIVGMIVAPFALITILTGMIILLFQGFYNLLNLHTWFRWGGLLIGAGLIFMFISGVALRLNEVLRRKRE
ncbi:MAG: hypothetical protein ACUVUD_05860 [bacterium]